MAATTKRKRMVVEEVNNDPTPLPGNTISDAPTVDTTAKIPLSEVKEKVEELHDITEDISDSLAKSEDVQEEIAHAVEDVAPGAIPSEAVHETPSASVVSAEPMVEAAPEPLQVTPPEEPVGVPLPTMPEPVPELKSSGTNPLVIIVPGIFLLGALLGGIYFYQKGTNFLPKSNPTPTPTEVATASAAPSAVPTATVDLTKYPVSILNGSGTPGEAGKVKDILTGGGFKVLTTGNASSYGFTKTVIKAKADVPASFLTELSSLLSKTYVLDANQTLPASSSDSVQIIVGSSKAK